MDLPTLIDCIRSLGDHDLEKVVEEVERERGLRGWISQGERDEWEQGDDDDFDDDDFDDDDFDDDWDDDNWYDFDDEEFEDDDL